MCCALISDLLPLDWCHIIYMRHFVATKGVFKGGGLNPPKIFLKSEGKEAVRKKMKKYVGGGGGGLPVTIFGGGIENFLSEVEIFSRGLRHFRWGLRIFFVGGGEVDMFSGGLRIFFSGGGVDMFSGGLRNLWWGLTCFRGGGVRNFR